MGKKRNRDALKDSEAPPSATMQTDDQIRPPKQKTENQRDAVNEIDEIFAKKKKKKQQPSSPELQKCHSANMKKSNVAGEKDATGSTEPKEKKKKKNKRKEWPDPQPHPRRKTADGFTVYSAEELGFNKKDAGGSSLCPFDCDCCF